MVTLRIRGPDRALLDGVGRANPSRRLPEEAIVSKLRSIQLVVISALPMLVVAIGHGRRWFV